MPDKQSPVRRTGQVDDNQDDLGRDIADTVKSDAPRHPQAERKSKTDKPLSGDALHDGAQH